MLHGSLKMYIYVCTCHAPCVLLPLLLAVGYPQLGRVMDKLLQFTGAMKPLNDLVEVCKKVVNNRRALADQVQVSSHMMCT